MNKAREKVLELLEKGKISKEEANGLLEAIEDKTKTESGKSIDFDSMIKQFDKIGKKLYQTSQDIIEQTGIDDLAYKIGKNIKTTTNEVMDKVDRQIRNITQSIVTRKINGKKTTIIFSYYKGDLDLTGEDIIILGKLDGNLKLKESSLKIFGKQEGDIYLTDCSADIMGKLYGDIKSYGNSDITLTGKINGDINICSGTIKILGNLCGDININEGMLRITGLVDGDISANVVNVDVLGKLKGDIEIKKGDLIVYRSSVINGDVDILEGDLILKKGAEINGSLNIQKGEQRVEDAGPEETEDKDSTE